MFSARRTHNNNTHSKNASITAMSAESNSAPKSELKVAATVTYAGAAWLALLGVLGQTRQRNRPLLLAVPASRGVGAGMSNREALLALK